MLRKALALFAIGALFAQTNAQEKAVAKPRAKLAVMLVFDQLRADYLMRYKDLFGPGGFNRFLDKGAWYQEAHYPYAFTVTGPGHASLGTGCPPRVHGIMGNDWRDRVTGSEIYCATTERQKNIPPAPPPTSSQGTKRVGGGSPERLLIPTVSDLLKQQSPQSRVAGFSLKDRGCVLPCGKLGDCVYYWDSTTGLFGTSTYYRDAVAPWVDEFNKARPADKWFNTTWNKLRADLDYAKLAGPDDVAGEGGQHVAKNDPPLAGASQFGSDNEIFLAKRQKAASDDPRQICPTDQGNNDGDRKIDLQCTPTIRQSRGQTHPQRNGWDGAQNLDHALDDGIHPAAIKPRDAAEQDTKHQTERYTGQADEKRYARRNDHA